MNTRRRLLRTIGKVGIECDQNLKYGTFDDETNGNINTSQKRLERAQRKNIYNPFYCLTLTHNNI